ncbi:hypothetical protein Tco_0030981 [Tanacetum coccineum]
MEIDRYAVSSDVGYGVLRISWRYGVLGLQSFMVICEVKARIRRIFLMDITYWVKSVGSPSLTKNKSFDTHDIHQQLHNIFFKSISLDQEYLNAQVIEPTLKKRPHGDQDPPNDHKED